MEKTKRPISVFMRLSTVAAALAFASFAATMDSQSQGPARVQAIRYWSFGDVTRIAIQTNGDYKLKYDQLDKPSRLYFDLNGLNPPSTLHRGTQIIQVNDRRVKQIRVAQASPGTTRVVFDLTGPVEVVSSQLVDPDRLMIEIRPKGTTVPALNIARSVTGSQTIDLSKEPVTNSGDSDDLPAPSSPKPSLEATPVAIASTTHATLPPPPATSNTPRLDSPTPAVNAVVNGAVDRHTPPPPVTHLTSGGPVSVAQRDSAGDRSLVRVFGLKLSKVVIDPGHGGHDTGTIGPNGLMEKDLVLDVGQRLGKLITQRLGAEVVFTRSDDIFIPLEQRTKIADQEKADLFVSVHANSSPEPSATGVETYYFNLTSDKTGLDLATRENASAGSSISDLNDLLHRAVLQTKMEESREFAQKVQASLAPMSAKMNSRARDRGVRQAPFMVLIGATMPSILAEIGFVSNPHDAKLMTRSDQRQKIAEALFKGVSQYASTLSRVQMARAGAGK